MTIAMGGVCHNGQIAKDGKWVDPSGHEHTGVGWTPCPKCGGKGCAPRPATVEDRVTRLEGEMERLKRELADARGGHGLPSAP